MLVNSETGNEITAASMPIWSPSKKRFAVASEDLEAMYNNNCLEIYSCDSKNCTKDWELAQPKDNDKPIGGESAKWVSDDEINFKAGTHDAKENVIQLQYHCKLKDKAWDCQKLGKK